MSHLVLMTLYAALVGFFFALLWRRGRQEQTKLFLQIFLGMMIGATAGYFGGWVAAVIMRVVGVILTVPDLPISIALSVILTDHG